MCSSELIAFLFPVAIFARSCALHWQVDLTATISSQLVPMDESLQDLLKKAWLGGRKGHMSALSEARAWALREMWRDAGESGLAPERVAYEKKPPHKMMQRKKQPEEADRKYFAANHRAALLRPQTAESLYYLYQHTKDNDMSRVDCVLP